MADKTFINVEDIDWYVENDPKWLTTLRIKLYDRSGNSSIFRAHQFTWAISNGFLAENPVGETERFGAPDLPNSRPMVESKRVVRPK